MEYNPFATGAVEGFMAQQDKNRDKRLQDQDRAAADADKRRKELENQFNTDITSVREMLAQTTDPQRREAIMRSLQVMKSAYTGASARQAGLADLFGRQIDLLMKAPSPSEVVTGSAQTEAAGIKAKVDALVSQGFTREQALAAAGVPLREYTPSSTGTSGGGGTVAERMIALKNSGQPMTPEQEALLEKATGGGDVFEAAFSKKYGKDFGEYYANLSKEVPQAGVRLQALDTAEKASMQINDYQRSAANLGASTDVIATATDYLGGNGAAVNIMSQKGVQDALKYVNDTKGAISDTEMGLFTSASAGIGKSPEFNKSMMQIAKAIVIRDKQHYEFLTAWMQKNGRSAESIQQATDLWEGYTNANVITQIDPVNLTAKLLRPVDEIMADTSYMSMVDTGVPQDTPQLPSGTALPDAGTAGPVDLNAERILPIPKAEIKPLDYYKNKYGVE